MSKEPIVVEIDATKKKAIILAALTGFTPGWLRSEDPSKMKVTDEAIKDFLCNLPPDQHHAILKGPFGAAFRVNGQAALDRLSEKFLKEHPEAAAPRNGRVASSGVHDGNPWDFTEVSRSNSTVDPARVRKDPK